MADLKETLEKLQARIGIGTLCYEEGKLIGLEIRINDFVERVNAGKIYTPDRKLLRFGSHDLQQNQWHIGLRPANETLDRGVYGLPGGGRIEILKRFGDVGTESSGAFISCWRLDPCRTCPASEGNGLCGVVKVYNADNKSSLARQFSLRRGIGIITS